MRKKRHRARLSLDPKKVSSASFFGVDREPEFLEDPVSVLGRDRDGLEFRHRSEYLPYRVEVYRFLCK